MTTAAESERVLVVDFGAQYGQLIARRVRDLNVFCQVVRHDLTADRVAELNPKGIILSGGPASVYEPNAPKLDPVAASGGTGASCAVQRPPDNVSMRACCVPETA